LPFDLTQPDWLTYVFAQMTVEGSARGLFNLLFGVGIVLITSCKGSFDLPLNTADVYFRRNLTLLALGVINFSLLLWYGDILFFYGIAGLILFAFRRLDAKILVGLALPVLILSSLPMTFEASDKAEDLRQGLAAEQKLAAQKPLSEAEKAAIERRKAIIKEARPTPDTVKSAYKPALSQDYPTIISWGVGMWMYFGGSGVWLYAIIAESVGLMLIGMALYKWGVLSGERSFKLYIGMAVCGYTIGWASRALILRQMNSVEFLPSIWWRALEYEPHLLAITLGHIGLILTLFKLNVLGLAGQALEALGRMALTNYLMQSLMAAIIFIGFQRINTIGWAASWAIASVILMAQMIFSLLWLRSFQFGPMEWLLRSISYGRLQSWRQAKA
jgi:uncharacterized protein